MMMDVRPLAVVLRALALTGALVAVVPGWPVRAGEGTSFVAGIEDLPLMPGLAPVEDQDLVFDKPAGRIVLAVVGGAVEPAAVRAFYAETVPQLGWRPDGPDQFVRDGERLRLDYQRIAGKLIVRFTLSPQ